MSLISPPASIRSDLYSPSKFDDTSTQLPTVLSVLSSLLERLVRRNERLPSLLAQEQHQPGRELEQRTGGYKCRSRKRGEIFEGTRAPNVSIEEYLRRVFVYSKCSPSCFVVAYAYIDRLQRLQQQQQNQRQNVDIIVINSLTVHRILITSILAAVKFLDDSHFDNEYYARIGGISTREMNGLEREFLFLMDFRFHVSVSVFESYCSHLEREAAFAGGYQIERALRSICCGLQSCSQSQCQRASSSTAAAKILKPENHYFYYYAAA